MLYNFFKNKKGFTLIETLVGVAVFLLISSATYSAYLSLFKIVNASQYRIAAINLANEQFEIAHNLPYVDVGIVGGIPSGKIPYTQTFSRSGYTFTATTTVRNIDLSFDGLIGSTTNDLSPADNKIVEIEVGCPTCKDFIPVTLTTQIAPKNLETASNNGALFIKVFDAAGVAVVGADVSVTNAAGTSTIMDVTNNYGMVQIIDIPPAIEAYSINVSKSGYSTDKTYKNSAVVPSTSSKLPASVLIQQVTQTSFAIDKVSTIDVSSVTDTCTAVPNFDFKMTGSKKIGTSPDLYKYDVSHTTNGLGVKTISNVEWDSYTFSAQDGDYDLIGINPLNPVSINPDAVQGLKLIVANKDPKSLLVTVKDSASQLPLTESKVVLDLGGTTVTKTTGRGFITQTDWSNGAASTDGNIDYTSTPGEIKLLQIFGSYVSNGVLTSTVIDTGASSNFQQFIWRPEYNPVSAGVNPVYFQIATAASSSGPWIYRGPDAATSSYYINPDSTINAIHDGDRYLRYKAYLQTATATTTPTVSDVSITFTTDCTPPGQVIFTNLSNGTYDITISKSGYSTTTIPITISGNWKEQEVLLSP